MSIVAVVDGITEKVDVLFLVKATWIHSHDLDNRICGSFRINDPRESSIFHHWYRWPLHNHKSQPLAQLHQRQNQFLSFPYSDPQSLRIQFKEVDTGTQNKKILLTKRLCGDEAHLSSLHKGIISVLTSRPAHGEHTDLLHALVMMIAPRSGTSSTSDLVDTFEIKHVSAVVQDKMTNGLGAPHVFLFWADNLIKIPETE